MDKKRRKGGLKTDYHLKKFRAFLKSKPFTNNLYILFVLVFGINGWAGIPYAPYKIIEVVSLFCMFLLAIQMSFIGFYYYETRNEEIGIFKISFLFSVMIGGLIGLKRSEPFLNGFLTLISVFWVAIWVLLFLRDKLFFKLLPGRQGDTEKKNTAVSMRKKAVFAVVFLSMSAGLYYFDTAKAYIHYWRTVEKGQMQMLSDGKGMIKSSITDEALFNHFQYNISNRGTFVLSSDKKSFYSNDIFSLHPVKQMDIDSSRMVLKTNASNRILAAWDEYVLGQKPRHTVLLLFSKDKVKTVKTANISDKFIVKAIIKDPSTAFLIDEDGTVFEINKNLEILKRYTLEDMGEEDSICYDNTSHIMYYGSKSKQIRALDLNWNKIVFTTRPLLPLEDEYAQISHLRLLKTKDKLLGALDDKLGIFDLKTKTIQYFGENSMKVNALDISPNYKYIISTGLSGGLKIWDYDTLKPVKHLQVESVGIKQSFHCMIDTVKFLDDDRFLYASSLEGVQMAQISTNRVIRDYSDKKKSCWFKKLPGNKLAIISNSAGIYHYDLSKHKVTRIHKAPLKHIKRVLDGKNSTVLLSQNNGDFILADLNRKQWTDYNKSLREHFTAKFDLSPGLDLLARLSSTGAMQVFDIKRGREIVRIENPLFDTSELFAFLDNNTMIHSSLQSAYNEQGNYARPGEAKPYLQFIDIKNKKIYHKTSHVDVVNSYNVSKDKQYLITAGADRTIQLWTLDLNDLDHTKVVDTSYGHNCPVYDVNLSADETKMVSFGTDGSIIIREIDLKTERFGRVVNVLEGNYYDAKIQRSRTQRERDVLFSKNIQYGCGIFFDNNKRIIITDSFSNINIYDLGTGKVLFRIVILGAQDWLQIYPDGRYYSSKNGYKHFKTYENEKIKVFDMDIKGRVVLKE